MQQFETLLYYNAFIRSDLMEDKAFSRLSMGESILSRRNSSQLLKKDAYKEEK
ncbi:hypothetical protein [Vallitalea okinawensis]|uniref:hypothetical protein n=1 Tax=Vallitalea okinawensis TaxID=2078660 RepID=UPI0013001787|nr:hypothetical protein [Vallitalea okinawensis]